jgi:hypothetical protein
MDILSLFSRRHMLLGLGGAAVAGTANARGLGNAGLFAQSLRTVGAGTLGTAGYADWLAQVGSNFTAASGQVLKLASVQAYGSAGSRPAGVRPTGFVARFDIIRGGALPEGSHLVAHGQRGGTFEIFLTKEGASKPLGMRADFN